MYKANKFFSFIVLCSLFSFLDTTADKRSRQLEAKNSLDQYAHSFEAALSPQKFRVIWDGYIKGEGIFDTYQTVAADDGQLLLYPTPRSFTVDGKDSNKRGTFDMYAVETRVTMQIFGPDTLGGRCRGYIEGDFFGRLLGGFLETFNQNVLNDFRMRHAYTEILWDNGWSFLAGQTWVPVYFPVVSPDTIDFNQSIPITPFRRSPQFRITYANDEIDLMLCAVGEIFQSEQGFNFSSDDLFRNSIFPELNFSARYKWGEHYIGLCMDLHRILPRLVTGANYYERAPLFCPAAMVYSRFQWDDFTIYSKLTYAEDAEFLNMIGGYAVHTFDPVTDVRTYVNLRTISWWAEAIYLYCDYIEPALFVGVAKNLGASKKIAFDSATGFALTYGLGVNHDSPGIDTLFRVSPRVRWYFEPIVFGLELEYTRAGWGLINNRGRVDVMPQYGPTSDIRLLMACYYFF